MQAYYETQIRVCLLRGTKTTTKNGRRFVCETKEHITTIQAQAAPLR